MKPMQIISIIVVVASIALGAIYFNQKPKQGDLSFPQHNLNLRIERAEALAQQAKGLMYRESLDENSGMLFIFTSEAKRTFWMKNTLIPLDLIFINGDKKIVEIKENFEPCREDNCPSYASVAKAQYVLEVNAGFVQKNQIQIGEEVVF
jgi:uncharacterized membrane protein (UPF0127 family)